jgi:hypothetical protein
MGISVRVKRFLAHLATGTACYYAQGQGIGKGDLVESAPRGFLAPILLSRAVTIAFLESFELTLEIDVLVIQFDAAFHHFNSFLVVFKLKVDFREGIQVLWTVRDQFHRPL